MVNLEYDLMIKYLNDAGIVTENLYYKYNKHHPITYAELDYENGYFERTLTHKDDLATCQSLDYIFCITTKTKLKNFDKNSLHETKLKDNGIVVKEDRTNVEISDNKSLKMIEEINCDLDFTANLKNLDLASINDTNKEIYILPDSLIIVRNLISEMNFDEHEREYTQLSDHYGLSCLIRIVDKLDKYEITNDTILLVKDEFDKNCNITDKKDKNDDLQNDENSYLIVK